MSDYRTRALATGTFLLAAAAAAAQWPGFGDVQTYTVGGNPHDVVAADFNKDGRVDLAVANEQRQVNVILGAGGGMFLPPISYSTAGKAYRIVAKDFNRDGNWDLFVSQDSPVQMTLLRGKGDGTFEIELDLAFNGGYLLFDVEDINADGILDFVRGSNGDKEVYIHLGLEEGGFSQLEPIALQVAAKSGGFVDLDTDPIKDLVIDMAESDLLLYKGIGDGTFQDPIVIDPTHWGANDFDFGDWNEDGLTDLCGSAYSYGIWIANQIVENRFSTLDFVYTSGYESEVVTLDLNLDFHDDIFTRLGISQNLALLGNGDGTFISQDIPNLIYDGEPRLAVDIDNDFDTDVVAISRDTGTLTFLINYLNIGPTPTPTPTPVPPPAGGEIGIVLAVEVTEDAIPSQGGDIRYIYVWSSNGDDRYIASEPTTDRLAMLRNGEKGATFDVGERWTIEVVPVDENGRQGQKLTGYFLITDTLTVQFEGWTIK